MPPRRQANTTRETVTNVSRATVFQSPRTASGTKTHEKFLKSFVTNQLPDPFKDFNKQQGSELAVVTPPYNPNALMKLPMENNTLLQCVDAMVTNIEGFGHSLIYVGEAGQEESAKAVEEANRVSGILEQPNGDYTMVTLRKLLRADLETVGYAFTEVCRDPRGIPSTFHHVPAHTMRVTNTVPGDVMVDMYLSRGGKVAKMSVPKRFRRFVQISNRVKVWFKQFGDTREVSSEDGLEKPETIPIEKQANEIFMLSLHRPGQVYGLPRWINQLPSILGSREAELTNLDFFKNNAIPALAILVSGGQLSRTSFNVIEQAFNLGNGRDKVNRALVLEATANDDSTTVDGQTPLPRLDIKPLGNDRQSDSLFDKYDEKCHVNVRGSFRIPPIFVGRADDYTRATAQASLTVAESQVFGPERKVIDDAFNLHLLPLPGERLKYWNMKANAPRLVGAEQVMEAATTLDRMGGLTPNIALSMANEMFGLELPEIVHDWGNYPFALVKMLAQKGNLIGIEELERATGAADSVTGNTSQEQKTDEGVRMRRKINVNG